MTIKKCAKVKCDCCDKVTETGFDEEHLYFEIIEKAKVPEGWYFLDNICIRNSKKKKGWCVKEDPQFCSKKCLKEFIIKGIDKLK